MCDYCFPFNFASSQMIGVEVFGQPSAGVCVIAAFICNDSDFSSCRCGPGCQYSGTEEVWSGWAKFREVMTILYYILQIMNSKTGATSNPMGLGPRFKVVVTWKTFPGRQVPAAGLYGTLLTLIHHHIIHRTSFGRTIYSVYSFHYLRTIFFLELLKDYNDLIQTASSSSSLRRQT